jgi:predicted DNA binding CopG/RHH family protein
MKRRKKIPSFKSVAAEENFWAVQDSTEYVDYRTVVTGFLPELEPSSRTLSVRLPVSIIEAIKVLANREDIPYQSMLKTPGSLG